VLQISDSGSGAVVEVHKAGFPDAVVWNPWIAKAQAMGDFGDEEYKVRRSYVAVCTHTTFNT
jgi:glucose-6-phosphate 1-epimerase